jgi:oligopeptidase A
MTETNPLLQIHFPVPFDQVRAAHVDPAAAELLAGARARLDALGNSPPESLTFEATLLELDTMTERLDHAMAVVRHLEGVATYPELRAAYNRVHPEVSAFYSGIPLHAGVWRVLKDYSATPEACALTGWRQRFLTKTLDTFRRHGADLDAAGKARLESIDVELARLTTKFSENVLDSTNAFSLVITDESKLAGLPPSAVAAAAQAAAAKNVQGWRFTLQAPSYLALLTHLDDAAIREHVYLAHSIRATAGDWDNRPILRRILELRRQKAGLLGFPNFADFALEDRMAHTGRRAQEFLRDLEQKTRARFRQENAELEEFAGRSPLHPWDIAYYAEKQRKALYDFDEESLRPYFPLERVVAGLFETAGRLYGLSITAEPDVPAWDPAAKYYSVRDAGGEFLGGFYADWHPRENKRGGAWMDVLITGAPSPSGFQPHLGLICGNLTMPVAGQPSLLTHREVETIFHEFGHLLHHLLSRVAIRSLAGTNVAWDFVELPSQIMENWCWERPALDLFARHFETGEPIPADLFQKMKRARNFRAANAQMRQLGFGMVDLALHMDYDAARDGDVMDYARALLQQFSPAQLPPGHALLAAFTHLFASPVGYGAGYYSYKWAEVLDADAFTRFREHGIFSPEIGGQFRDHILSRGDSEDPAELYRRFMGRDPDPNALLERSGLLCPPAAPSDAQQRQAGANQAPTPRLGR